VSRVQRLRDCSSAFCCAIGQVQAETHCRRSERAGGYARIQTTAAKGLGCALTAVAIVLKPALGGELFARLFGHTRLRRSDTNQAPALRAHQAAALDHGFQISRAARIGIAPSTVCGADKQHK